MLVINKNTRVEKAKYDVGDINFKSSMSGQLEKLALRALVWEIFLLQEAETIGVTIRNRKSQVAIFLVRITIRRCV